MPVTRKRKAVSPEPRKQTSCVKPQKSMRDFARVTKAPNKEQSAKKRKTEHGDVEAHASKTLARRHEKPSTDLDDDERAHTVPQSSKKRQREEDVTTPRQKRFKDALPPTPTETPTRGARNLFDKLNIAPVPSELSRTPRTTQPRYDTPPLSPKSLGLASDLDEELPGQMRDLITLFSSFLTATSFYYAHHGASSRLYLQELTHVVTKSWKKRAVTESDIRRVLYILAEDGETFVLVDNGERSVYVEQAEGIVPGHFNQPVLNSRFQKNLRKLWQTWKQTPAHRSYDVVGFLQQIPLASTTRSEVAPVEGRPSKGQQRLDDIKAGAIQARAEHVAAQKPAVAAEAKTSAAVSSRGSSLLDRILAKQQANSLKGSGPTPEEMEKKAALHRIEEISLVLDLLAGGRPRVSFSTQMMVSHLQNSLRNPIAKNQAERCLELMASEVAPAFVSVIHAGHVKGVVITKAGRPSSVELRQRLERAGA
ncbi:hypothetical protein MBLNU459_g0702t1 [Dothideomycetes sp. NU459]